MIPEGTYRAKCVDSDFGESPNGHKQVAAKFEIKDGPTAGQRLSWWGYFNTKENAARAVRVMNSCGWDCHNVHTMNRNEVEIVVRHEKFNGKTRARIAFVNEVRGLAMARPLTEPEKVQLQSRVAELAREMGIGKPVNEVVDEPDPAPGDADDIPF